MDTKALKILYFMVFCFYFFENIAFAITTAHLFEINNTKYIAVVVRPGPGQSFLSEILYTFGHLEKDLDDWYFDLFEDFVLSQYVARGRLRDPQIIEDLRRTETVKDGRSSIVLITEYDRPREILATLRVSYPLLVGSHPNENSPDGLLPLERRLGITVEKPGIAEGARFGKLGFFFAEGTAPNDANGALLSRAPQPLPRNRVLTGYFGAIITGVWPYGAAELKNFVVRRPSAIDWIPLLYHIAEREAVTRKGFDHIYGSIHEPTMSPRVYYLECDARAREYYKRKYGFSDYLKIDDDIFILSITREKWLSAVRDAVKNRLGLSMVRQFESGGPIKRRQLLRLMRRSPALPSGSFTRKCL